MNHPYTRQPQAPQGYRRKPQRHAGATGRAVLEKALAQHRTAQWFDGEPSRGATCSPA